MKSQNPELQAILDKLQQRNHEIVADKQVQGLFAELNIQLNFVAEMQER